MTILQIFRAKRQGIFSLETVFKNINSLISEQVKVEKYSLSSSIFSLKDLKYLKKKQNVIYHLTGANNLIIFFLKGKTILTVHDIGNYLDQRSLFRKFFFKWVFWKIPLKLCTTVTTISSFSKNEIVREFNVPENKVQVIHNAVSKSFEFNPNYLLSKVPKILQVGGMNNKNVYRLINAVKDIPCKLLFLRNKERNLINKLNKWSISHEFYENLTEEEVIELYKKSDIIYLASTYEGFGMPIIEAQAIGRPVITSNICSMPEIAGAGAHYVDPYNVLEIREGLLKIINDKAYRESLVTTGLKNVKRFKAEKIAYQYIDLYNEIAQN